MKAGKGGHYCKDSRERSLNYTCRGSDTDIGQGVQEKEESDQIRIFGQNTGIELLYTEIGKTENSLGGKAQKSVLSHISPRCLLDFKI